VTVGGVFVSKGLWDEWKGREEREWFRSAAEYHRAATLRKRGEVFVIIGVVIETIVAGTMFGRELWQAKRTEAEIEKNSPLNQPISWAYAVVQFTVNKADFVENPPYGGPRDAELLMIESPPTNFSAGMRFCATHGLTQLPILDTQSHEFNSVAAGRDARDYMLQFHIDEHGGGFLLLENKSAKDIGQIKVVTIQAKWLPHDLKILNGSVRLFINNLSRTFVIPPQKHKQWADPRDGVPDLYNKTTPYVIFAFPTNATPEEIMDGQAKP
jgi:hypothetical protein